jgi:cadmium resistance protein CadD (predicted permease)
MIQRALGAGIGAIVTLILLLVLGPSGAVVEDYIPALVIGAIVTLAWPIVIGWWLIRRRKSKGEQRIEDEVQRQLDQQ